MSSVFFISNRTRFLDFVSLFFISIFLFFYPVFFIFFLIFVVSVINFGSNVKRFLGCILIGAFFSLINLIKIPESDMMIYIEALNEIVKSSFYDVFNFSFVSLRSSEFVFNIYLYILSNIDLTGFLFSFLSVFIIYFNLGLTVFNLSYKKDIDFLVIVFSLFLCFVTFSLSGHLVRQYLAVSFILLGVSYIAVNKNRAYILSLASMFIHNSLIPFVLFYPLIYAGTVKYGWKLMTFLSLSFSFVASSFVFLIKPYMEIGFVKDDGSIPIVLIVFDASVFFLFSFFVMNKKECFYVNALKIFPLFIMTASVLIITKDVPLLFLRFYFLVDFLRPVALALLFFSIIPKSGFRYSSLIFINIMSFSIFILRLDSSPWDYGFDGMSLLFFSNVSNFIDRVLYVWS
ncbi:EpsG family protein [Vibrio parahaemolyticus]